MNHVRHHLEPRQPVPAEGGDQGDVGGVAAAGHQDPAGAGAAVAGVHRPPAVVEIDFVERAEVHRRRVGVGVDVAEVPGRVAGGDVHGAAEGDGQVGHVAAGAGGLDGGVQRRLVRAGEAV